MIGATRAVTVALLAALAMVGVQTHRLSAEQRDHANTRAAHAEQMQALERAAADAQAAARNEEQRRTEEVQKVTHEANEALERARADAGAAADAGQRLRTQIAVIAAACGRATTGDTGHATPGPAADATADLLADVQRRIDAATDGIARHADEARAAGQACQRSYDALTAR